MESEKGGKRASHCPPDHPITGHRLRGGKNKRVHYRGFYPASFPNLSPLLVLASSKVIHRPCLERIFRKIVFTFTYYSSKNVGSHLTFLTSHFKFYILNFSFTCISCILHFITCSVKLESHFTFPISPIPNVICGTNMKREFHFLKNALLEQFLPFSRIASCFDGIQEDQVVATDSVF